MSKERDLLPWVLGALCATVVAVAITAVSSNKSEPPAAPAPSATTSSPAAPPLVGEAAVAGPAAEPDIAAPQSAVQAQAAPESSAPSGQVWECTTKGVKTFSNNPCGDKSTLLEIAPINTMNPAPTIHYARTFAPEPAYAESDSSDQEPYSDQTSAESVGDSYAIVRGVGFIPRRRPEHSHHRPMPHHRNSGPIARKN